MKTRENERRDYVIIIALILLLGFICIILASGWALRFDPSWKSSANMNSNLNPDSDFLTSRPVNFIEPLDPSILTNPVWLNVFLTPGASFSTYTPLPPVGTSTFTPIPPANTKQATSTLMVTATSVIVFPTSTPKPSTPTFIPSGPTATRTSTKIPTITFTPTATFTPSSTATATATSTSTPTNTPFPSADLQITKDDGVVTYNPGGGVTYSIVVTNNGPNDAIGAVVTDVIPWQVTSWDWVCFAQSGGATGCDAVAGSSANFTDTINLPAGASITYSVSVNTSPASTGELTNTVDVDVSVPPTAYTDPNITNNSAMDIDGSANEPDVGPPDGNWYTISSAPGSYIVIDLGPGNINYTGNLDGGSYDLVYFERYYYVGGVPQSVQLDCVLIQMGTSATGPWYDVFYWCDGAADTNTNVDINVIGGTETDNRTFMPGQLYGIPIPPYNAPPYDSGVTIDMNAPLFNVGAPNGVYRYLKISQPPSGGGADGPGLDAIYICPAGGC